MLSKILVVDDEPDLELLVTQKFRKEIRAGKYQFTFVNTGKEALLTLQQQPDIDLVLSDINMPGMDGLALLAKTQEINPIVKTVIVSGYGDMERIRKAMNNGAFDFLTKPIDFEDLKITIKKTLNHVEEIKEKLRLQQEQSRILHQQALVFENIHDAIIITDISGHIIDWNPSAERMFGYAKAEVLGKTPEFLHLPEKASVLIQEILGTVRKGDRRAGEINFICKNGKEIICESISLPLYDAFLEKTAVIWVNHDITARKQAEAEIQKALIKEKELNELKSRFVSMVSHEFRTPLSIIVSCSDLLLSCKDKFSEEKQEQILKRIPKSAHHMNSLLNGVLVLSQAQLGKTNFTPVPLNLEIFSQEILEEIQLTDQQHHKFIFNCNPQKLSVKMDENILKHILFNLLSNAVKYSPESSLVSLNILGEKEQVICEVKDEGIGISVLDQERLFEAFHRGSNVGKISGTGLGMAIVHNAVKLHGGSITVKSQVGAGTTFTVCLPLIKSAVV